jgi:hypothetical protein
MGGGETQQAPSYTEAEYRKDMMAMSSGGKISEATPITSRTGLPFQRKNTWH